MARLGLLASIATIVAALGFATMSTADDAPPPCKRTDFKTDLAKDACGKGGQKAAKAAMDGFMKEAKKAGAAIKTCQNPCHKSLAPNYELKDNAVDEFNKAKKLIEDKKKK